MGLTAHINDASSQIAEAGKAWSLKSVGTFTNESPTGRGTSEKENREIWAVK